MFRATLAFPVVGCMACTDPTLAECVSGLEYTEPGVAEAFLDALDRRVVPDDPLLPPFELTIDLGTVETMKVVHGDCGAPDRTFANADIEVVDDRGGHGSGEVETQSIERGEVGAWFTWSPTPADIDALEAEAEAELGPLGPWVEAWLALSWSSELIHVNAHFADPTQEGGTRQVTPNHVAGFAVSFTPSP